MVLESTLGLMGGNMKDSMWTTKNKDLEFIPGLMEGGMRVTG